MGWAKEPESSPALLSRLSKGMYKRQPGENENAFLPWKLGWKKE